MAAADHHACMWAQYVVWKYLGDVQVIFRLLRVTYYTGYMFGFNVDISYIYSIKLQIKVLLSLHTFIASFLA